MNIWFVDGAGASSSDGFGKICVIKVGENPKVMDVLIKGCTNNSAEYIAMLNALQSCDDGDVIHTDSQLVVGQLTKNWSVNASHLQVLHDMCVEILKVKKVQILWIPRSESLAGKILERDAGRSFPVGNDRVEPVDEPYVPKESEARLIWEINQFKKASVLSDPIDNSVQALGIEF